MPAKKSTKSKPTNSRSRVSAKSKKRGFQFKWWMALLLVLIVGGVGIVVYRASFAGLQCSQAPTGAICDNGPVPITVKSRANTPDCRVSTGPSAGGQLAPANGPLNSPQFCVQFSSFNSPFGPTGGNQYDPQTIYKMSNNFNTSCGRISKQSPFGAFKRRQDAGFVSPGELFQLTGFSNQALWWTSVGC